jgi:type IV secretory pathway protease TraF
MRRWLWVAGLAAAAWGTARAAGSFRVEVAGSSMAPTLRSGDWLVATRAGRVRRGSVVVVGHPALRLDLVKRVTAVPGDRVGGRILAPDEYLVVGDRPQASTDGRRFGPVPRAAIEGLVRLRYWPRPGLVR